MRPLFRRKRLTLRTIIRFCMFTILGGVLVALLWQGDCSLQVLACQEQEVSQLQACVTDLQEGIQGIEQEMVAYESDPYVLEKLAREQLGMGKTGETVYVLN